MHLLLTFGIFIIGIVTGFLDSTVGAGGSVSIPSLIFVGLSPQLAVVTDRVGSVGQSFSASLKFWKSGKIRWNYLLLYIVISLIGTYYGTHILLSINPKLLQRIIGLILLSILPLTFANKNFGIKQIITSKIKKAVGSLVLFGLYILNGFLGVGAGGIAYYNSVYFYGFTFIEANATAAIPVFLLSVFSVALYLHASIINVSDGLSMLIGMSIGGYIGAHTALKKGEQWVKRLLTIVIALACIKLIVF